MKTIIITGSEGFIGKTLCQNISDRFKVIGIDRNVDGNANGKNYRSIRGDISDPSFIDSVFSQFRPDVVVHCAALTKESLFSPINKKCYEQFNTEATETLCKSAAMINPDVFFIFLSTISVYGETVNNHAIKDDAQTNPSSNYAVSKHLAEKALQETFKNQIVKHVEILRLAPVYDKHRLSNIEKRVLAPKRLAYIRFGSGKQRLSILSIHNLVDYICFKLNHIPEAKTFSIHNVCDKKVYSFEQIISVLKKNHTYANPIVIKVPLSWIWVLTRCFGFFFKGKTKWIYSWYDKLAKNFIFDNSTMLASGFTPKYDFEHIFEKGQKVKKNPVRFSEK